MDPGQQLGEAVEQLGDQGLGCALAVLGCDDPGRERLRAKLSYTNLGFALAPATFTMAELRDLYAAALGHEVSATNLKRVLLRRGVLEPTGERRRPGKSGGRPAEVYRFSDRTLAITDQFAVLRPPA